MPQMIHPGIRSAAGRTWSPDVQKWILPAASRTHGSGSYHVTVEARRAWIRWEILPCELSEDLELQIVSMSMVHPTLKYLKGLPHMLRRRQNRHMMFRSLRSWRWLPGSKRFKFDAVRVTANEASSVWRNQPILLSKMHNATQSLQGQILHPLQHIHELQRSVDVAPDRILTFKEVIELFDSCLVRVAEIRKCLKPNANLNDESRMRLTHLCIYVRTLCMCVRIRVRTECYFGLAFMMVRLCALLPLPWQVVCHSSIIVDWSNNVPNTVSSTSAFCGPNAEQGKCHTAQVRLHGLEHAVEILTQALRNPIDEAGTGDGKPHCGCRVLYKWLLKSEGRLKHALTLHASAEAF
eukprot:gnl/MRDRNA2_/MRDRNA2_173004_c0_seq1.p1 gnl/MRDRNA2_/MRDRNA2_173004_c0~~gnl/MRDRNA2_/MRDRNA2_173004_c0_seq1.p1  ORF type:complete len:403 (+),score=35.76 gnl/MRDRNA2_/MRDRNA2_173004_c0_seq1:157-1209(+)